MTNRQKLDAIKELSTGLTARELRDLAEKLEDKCGEVCETEGHYPTDDQCGLPGHRYCWICCNPMPNVQIPSREVEVNETAASKAAAPSASLGSGSN